jgi:hypothetical protein
MIRNCKRLAFYNIYFYYEVSIVAVGLHIYGSHIIKGFVTYTTGCALVVHNLLCNKHSSIINYIL